MTTTLTDADRLHAIESLDELVVTLDSALRVTSCNDAATRLLGGGGALVGTALLQLLSPELRLDEGKRLARALDGETIGRHQLTFVSSGGKPVPVSIAIAPVGSAGARATGLVLLGRDETAHRRLQAQFLEAKRMETTGQLAGGIAHEFNNILTAILALADFTARELPAGEAREDLEEIRQQATRGARLVRHLLAFSRRQVDRPEVVHFADMFQELEPLIQRLVSEIVLIDVDVADDSLAVDVDRAQLELVLLELAAGTGEGMAGGGTLTVSVKPVTLGADDPAGMPAGAYAEISVHGVAHDESGEAPRQASSETPRLGLAMIDEMVRRYRGRVLLDSAETPGVRILLPATGRRIPTPAHSFAPGDLSAGNETILVVEDEAAVRNIVCRSLAARGYNVLEAKNGEDALLVAERHNAPIHLVITDVVMPEMGGADLFHHLRRWYPTMRVLFISGYTRGAVPPEALEEGGGAAFLAKPFTLDQLATEVRGLIAQPRPTTAV